MSKTAQNAIDALGLDVETPVKMTILNPATGLPLRDKEGKEAFIEHLSADSAAAEKIQKALRSARLRSRNPGKIDLDREHVELLVALTKGWYLVDLRGNAIDLPLSDENATALYSARSTRWIFDQLDESAGDRANFLKASPAS